MEAHDFAELFPMFGEAELSELAASIKANGQRQPIITLGGRILDGRNRYRACEIAGVEPEFCELPAGLDPLQFVLDHNLHRRHLTDSQRAMVGARLKDHYAAEAKERQREGGKSAGKGRPQQVVENLPQPIESGKARDKAAESVGVSGKLIDAAAKVAAQGVPELSAAVVSGDMAVTRAAKIAALPAQEQPAAIAEAREHPRQATEADDRLKQLIEKWPDKLHVLRLLYDACEPRQRSMAISLWVEWESE